MNEHTTVPLTVNIIGLGLIGGSLASALREHGCVVHGVDINAENIAAAEALGLIDSSALNTTADISVVATPVGTIPQVALELLAKTTGVVTDVGSVKGDIVGAVVSPRFVGGHPMAGSEQDGVLSSRSDLFFAATWVLTPGPETSQDATAVAREMAVLAGAEVVTMSAQEHDDAVAVVSHVPHLAAASLMTMASQSSVSNTLVHRLAAGGFRDMTRIAAGSPKIWPDICAANREAVVEILAAAVSNFGLDIQRKQVEVDGVSLPRFELVK